jgi:PelA/Pel-15E family pectate lyase
MELTKKYFMKINFKVTLIFLIVTFGTTIIYCQKPLNQLSWKFVATGMPDEWYGSEESKAVTENVLLYQRDSGGWPKNTSFHKPLSVVEKTKISDEKGLNDAILDNDATTTEMKFLARMYSKTGNEKYKIAFVNGLNFIFDAQYDNGGWPMFYPLRKGYYTHITFNDNCIVNVLELFKDIFNKNPLYVFVESEDVISRTKKAFNKGIDCILKTQIIINGKPTVWCAQHDEKTFLPAKARSYELPSFSGEESAGILKVLMEISDPSPEIIKSVQSATEWLNKHSIRNSRMEIFINKDGQNDKRLVSDPKAGDIWARFYDLDTGLPFFCDRDGIKKNSLNEIGYERRNGYNWYTDAPQKILDKYPEWKAKWVK